MTKRQTLSFVATFLLVTLISTVAFAQDAAGGDNNFTVAAYIAMAEGFGLAIAAFGGALAQGMASRAALEGIARNPGAAGKIFTPMILGLALIESLVIYSLLVAFFLNGHLEGMIAKF